MKATRRLAALAAAATMTACMAVPMVTMNVSATGTITINDSATSGTSTELKAFQIFTAEVSGAKFVVTGWGNGIDVSKLATAWSNDATLSVLLDKTKITADATGAQAVADVLSQYVNDSVQAAAFAKIAAQCTVGANAISKNAGEGIVFTVDDGYYILVDTQAATSGAYSAYTNGILRVMDGTALEVTPKREYPTFDKQIGDINDTTGGDYTYNEAADHDIGDAVPFKLIATLPSNIADYTAYMLKFHDDLQADVFTLNTDSDSIKVTYTDSNDIEVDVTTAFTLTTTELGNDSAFTKHTDGAKDFTLHCNDIKKIVGISVEKGGKFEVSYTALLTDNANLGATGNWNGAYLEYSNNPNWDGTGTSDTGTSPVDYVVAFTYQAIVNKIDGVTGAPLAGAEFTLYKEVGGAYQKIGKANAKNVAGTTFEFKGLDDGTYRLEETVAPAGYTAAPDIVFTITAEENMTDGSEALISFASDNTAVTARNVFVLGADDKYADGVVPGAVSATIENKKGSTLPSTGGIGTTIFYVVGSLMVGVAGVYLIAKKRMKNNEQ
ncbi:MAG: SpaA isopeptide-forming pilin-related protein [Oscillospiraceae bacterium]|nr:SpaA isopeptide-forming pilin-related protein [Oscillospiraceae bacterium]